MIRKGSNYDSDVASYTSGLDFANADDRTQQHMRDETDINKLVALYARTGRVPGADIPAMNFEFDEVFDYQKSMNAVIAADRAFGALPSDLRDRFRNDPGRLWDFVNDESNRAEAEKLGLLRPTPPQPDVIVPQPQTPDPVVTGSETSKA